MSDWYTEFCRTQQPIGYFREQNADGSWTCSIEPIRKLSIFRRAWNALAATWRAAKRDAEGLGVQETSHAARSLTIHRRDIADHQAWIHEAVYEPLLNQFMEGLADGSSSADSASTGNTEATDSTRAAAGSAEVISESPLVVHLQKDGQPTSAVVNDEAAFFEVLQAAQPPGVGE